MKSPERSQELFESSLNRYQDYSGKPKLYTAQEAIQREIIQPLPDGQVAYRPPTPEKQSNLGEEVILNPSQVFDLVMPTLFGLNEVLVPGLPLTQQFQAEWDKFTQASTTEEAYGVYAFYPKSRHLVRFMEPFWHRLALVVSNSELYMDLENKLSWDEVRKVFEKTVVAVAGCSVGNSIAFCIASNLRPIHMKLADPKEAHLANANRVRWLYTDIGRNKAIVTAEQLHAIDPYLHLSVYREGIHEDDIVDFVAGNKTINEPPATIIVEETDDPEMKILIREIAREKRVPVLMITDAGSIIQRDIRRFDLDHNLSLAVGIPDDQLYSARREALNDPGNREKFFEFAFALVGTDCLRGEFERIVRKKIDPLFGSVPQLGSTTSAAGGYAAESVCRAILGYPQFERELIDLQTGKVVQTGTRH